MYTEPVSSYVINTALPYFTCINVSILIVQILLLLACLTETKSSKTKASKLIYIQTAIDRRTVMHLFLPLLHFNIDSKASTKMLVLNNSLLMFRNYLSDLDDFFCKEE